MCDGKWPISCSKCEVQSKKESFKTVRQPFQVKAAVVEKKGRIQKIHYMQNDQQRHNYFKCLFKKIKTNEAKLSFTFKPKIRAVSLLNINARAPHNPAIALHSL